MAIIEVPEFSLINMLEGPTAGEAIVKDADFDEGYCSVEIFTQEKYFYLFYQGLRMLEQFYQHGLTHGHINATTLRIRDDYSLCVSDLSIATLTPGYSQMDAELQESITTRVRGFNTETMSEVLQSKLFKGSVLESLYIEDQEVQDGMEIRMGDFDELRVSELIQEDWRDLIAAFFFLN
jgi:hypothetical protein